MKYLGAMAMKLSELAKRLGGVEITISEDESNIMVRLDNSRWRIYCPKGNETAMQLLLSLLAKCYQETKRRTLKKGKQC